MSKTQLCVSTLLSHGTKKFLLRTGHLSSAGQQKVSSIVQMHDSKFLLCLINSMSVRIIKEKVSVQRTRARRSGMTFPITKIYIECPLLCIINTLHSQNVFFKETTYT